MKRRGFVTGAIALALGIAWIPAFEVSGQVPAGATVRLQDQLLVGLRPGRPQDKAFILKVVALTQQGVLPLSLVNSTYLWARKKPRYKVNYFEQALRVRARRLRIEI
jgi:hypothetical protein